MKKKFYLLMFATSLLSVTSCEKDGNDDQNNGTTGRYIHWTRFEQTTPNQFSRSARLVKDGKIYASPYSSSSDGGVTWVDIPNDGLGREFLNLNGDFWVESRNSGTNTKIYQAISGGSSITFNTNFTTGNVAWEGGSTAYSYLNNSGSTYGGAWDNDYILVSNNSGTTWTPITMQPPAHNGPTSSYEWVRLIDGKLFALSRIFAPGGFTNYQLHYFTGNSWISSSVYSYQISLRKVTGHGIFALMNGGTYRFEITGPSFSFQEIEFEDDFNNSTNTQGIMLNAGGNLLIGSEFKLFIPRPQTDRMYNPSPLDGSNSLPGIGGMVLFGNELIVTRGSFTYKTPFPFVFHQNP